MVFIILATLIYAALTAVSTTFLTSLSVPVFLGILYVVPVGINLLLTYMQKTDKSKLLSTLVLPTLSIGFYLLFARLTSESGAWSEFVQMNTLEEADMSVDIAENLFSVGQLVFASLTYYVSSAGMYVLTKATKKQEMKGIKYA